MSDTVIITKVHDAFCDVCKHMERHDQATFESFPEVLYQKVLLDDVINHQSNLTKVRIYQILEKYCLSPSYEIDLPVYLAIDKQGTYKGHLQGALTVQEIREGVKTIMGGYHGS
jgi:hypothetical protein